MPLQLSRFWDTPLLFAISEEYHYNFILFKICHYIPLNMFINLSWPNYPCLLPPSQLSVHDPDARCASSMPIHHHGCHGSRSPRRWARTPVGDLEHAAVCCWWCAPHLRGSLLAAIEVQQVTGASYGVPALVKPSTTATSNRHSC